MSLRSFALVLAVVLAGTPALGVVCAMDCEHSAVASSPPCHEAGVPHDDTMLGSAPHACDHDHMGSSPALLTSATGRDSVATSPVVPAPTFVHGLFSDAPIDAVAITHAPLGLSCRSTSTDSTVLRI